MYIEALYTSMYNRADGFSHLLECVGGEAGPGVEANFNHTLNDGVAPSIYLLSHL